MLKLSTLLRSTLSSVMLSLLLTAGSGCKDSSQSQGVGWQPNVPFGTLPPGFDSFPERWNKQINDRLAREEAAKQKEIRELRDKFFKEEDSKVREKLQSKLIADEAALSVIHRRQTEGDYIKFKTPADIPQDLKWEDGLDNPEIGDPNAKKGGVLRQWAPGSYPDTFRPNGPNSNSGFRGPLYDEIIIGLVSIHPVTGKIIPGIAHKWAESPDRRTVYFELDPDARYTDGAKVKAIDLLVNMYIRTSEYSRDVFYNNFFTRTLPTSPSTTTAAFPSHSPSPNLCSRTIARCSFRPRRIFIASSAPTTWNATSGAYRPLRALTLSSRTVSSAAAR